MRLKTLWGDSLTTELIERAVTDVGQSQKDHILQDKHGWDKLVPDPKDPNNWDKVAAIIASVLANGDSEIYKGAFQKSMQVGNEVVTVVYQIVDGVVKLGNAWVNN